MATGHQRKLIVEVVDARNLSPKDGHGTSSPYVIVDYYGQRKRTRTVVRDLNPTWNEALEFDVGPPSSVFGDVLELDVNHDRSYGATRRSNFLGRIRLSSTQFVNKGEEALIYFHLEKKSLFSWIQGDIGLRIYYVDDIMARPHQLQHQEATKPTNETSVVENIVAETPTIDGNVVPPIENSDVDSSAVPTAENLTVDDSAVSATKNPTVDGTTTLATENMTINGTATQAAENSTVDDTTTQVNESTTPAEIDEAHPSLEMKKHVDTLPNKSLEDKQTQTIPALESRPVSSYTLESTECQPIERSRFDLVEKMHYLFVRVVKARSLVTTNRAIVKIEAFGKHVTSKPSRMFEWDQTFAFSREAVDSASTLQISVWDVKDVVNVEKSKFLGGLSFEVSDILLRDPLDSPLAPQWYRLETERNGVAFGGYLMLAMWIGTQADDAFGNALMTDDAGSFNCRAKIYQSPKLWYLRASVIEAQDVVWITTLKEVSFQVRAQLGFQVSVTRPVVTQNGAPSWNEDLLFVAAEPMTDRLVFTLESCQSSKSPTTVGIASIPLTEIERRVDDRIVTTRWCTLTSPVKEKESSYKGRIQVRVCFDGGYYVMDEAAHVSSDYRPTARQLWKPPLGLIEMGVIGCKNLIPMNSMTIQKGSTDAYCVAKYGSKWVRTRTICNSYDPKWNEQYTWQVYDPCTVLTIGVFNKTEDANIDGSNELNRPDSKMGKIRIRVSTLKTGKVYRNFYPLVVLSAAGPKKMGEFEIAVRFVRTSPLMDFLHVYTQPLLPSMHHVKPIGVRQQDQLRRAAVETVVGHFSRSEPPLRRETVLFMLDAESNGFSMRKVRANWYRVTNVVAAVIATVKWIDDIRSWRNPTSTTLFHALLVLLIWYPELIIPTISFYAFVTGAWNYKFRSPELLPHYDLNLSMIGAVELDELDEEFDGVPSTRSPEIVQMRYDKLRAIGTRIQSLLGDLATLGERVQALVTWRDPRATGIFTAICFAVAVVLYLIPLRMAAVACGFYFLRHPIFRDRFPSPVLNFLRRLPSLSDQLM